MKIPSNNQWSQTNQGDILGILHETENMSFETTGIAKLSKKAFKVYSSDNDADFGYVYDISYFDNGYHILTDDNVFKLDLNLGTVTEIAHSGSHHDAQVVYDRYYVTTNTTTDYWNGSAWAGNQESLTSGVPHPMTVFDSMPTYKLAIGNGSAIIMLDSSGSAASTTLSLPSQYQISTIRYRNGYLYVGTKHLYGGEAKVFIWDGNTANANYEVPTGSSQVFSMTEYGNTVAYMTEKGDLSLINGTQAQLLAALPVYYDPNAVWEQGNGVKMVHEGMKTVGNTIYLNLDGDVDSKLIPEMKSGIWVYDPAVGLYHRSYCSDDQYVEDTGLSVTNSVITTSAAHNLMTGDTVMFSATSGLSGVDNNVRYYVDVQSTTTIKLALSRKSLKAGNYVTITGTAGIADKLVYVPNTQWRDSGFREGAIGLTTPLENQLEMWESPVMWGAAIDDLDGSVVYGLYAFTESWNIGRITTQRIFTNNLTQAWQAVVGFVKGLLSDNEKAILKYKKEDKLGYPTQEFQAVWGSANEIHSNTATYDEDEWSDLEVGDELTITRGYGRGYTTHITDITTSTNTYVLMVDESIGTAQGIVYFYADNFKKVSVQGNSREHSPLLQWAWGVIKSPWIQLKVELRGYETEFYGFDVDNGKDK